MNRRYSRACSREPKRLPVLGWTAALVAAAITYMSTARAECAVPAAGPDVAQATASHRPAFEG